MIKYIFQTIFLFILFVSFLGVESAFCQNGFDSSYNFNYRKRELNLGVILSENREREELKTDDSREYDELTTGAAKFMLSNRYWNFLDYKQEQIVFDFEAGPLMGNGNWIDSTAAENAIADQKIFGFRTQGYVDYISRYYYSEKSFTLVQVDAKAKYDYFLRNSEGEVTDSNGVSSGIDEKENISKLRYGFLAKAGWGIGRLNPVNHFMIADYLFDKYYKGRTFSFDEISELAKQIGKIKQSRDIRTGHDNQKETEQIQQFINQKMLLTLPEMLYNEWQYGEFLPRFNGTKVEFGPFFRYYNREPDFIYGAYLLFENDKYCNYKWNRNFKAGINYNYYKKQDWALGEIDLSWSYYIKLRSQIDFGFKYVPGIQLNNFEDVGKLNHGFIPHIGYYSQLNSSTRLNFAFAWRISQDESLMLSGPEFSLSVYKSRY